MDCVCLLIKVRITEIMSSGALICRFFIIKISEGSGHFEVAFYIVFIYGNKEDKYRLIIISIISGLVQLQFRSSGNVEMLQIDKNLKGSRSRYGIYKMVIKK